ncbi:TonB-dependent siderophore receptor [Solilutibacter pythonis]|uniref:TonB-dependent siderophore receptor n=1 Tax=Solilutibacter pythonis TaxID=2483112 RepID=UPI001314EC78|nr:TonB-dependent siderophore receptor [Lysobacter pythonis]
MALALTGVAVSSVGLAQQETAEARRLDRVTVVAQRAGIATKTDTPLNRIPQSVSVISADLARSRGADTLQDMLRYSAGVTAEPYGLDPRADGFFVRGLDAQQTLDGFRRLYNYSPVPRVDVFAIDRVEILRGPASVLYGQGTAGGLVNAVSKRPRAQPGAEMSVRLGSFSHRELRMDATGELNTSGTLTGRMVAVARDAELPTRGLPNDRQLLAPSLEWQVGERTRLTWLGLVQRDNSASAQQFLPVAAVRGWRGKPLDDVRLFVGDRAHDRLNARQVMNTLLAEHDFDGGWSLSAKVRDSLSRTDFVQIYADSFSNPLDPFLDSARRVVGRYYYGVRPVMRSQQADVTVRGQMGTGVIEHDLLFGVDYARFRQHGETASGKTTPIDLDAPVSTGVVALPYKASPRQRSRQLGVYAQDQMRFGERFTWVLGARHDQVAILTEGSPDTRQNATTWRTGLVYEVAPGLSPYIGYSESFTPVQGVDVYGKPYQPLRGEQFEAGVKWMPSRRLALTLAGFRMEERNRMTNDPNNIANSIQTGRVRSRGGEVELLYSGAHGWSATASAGYHDVTVIESNYGYERGRQLADVPRYQGALWLDKRTDLAAGGWLSLGGGARRVGPTTSWSARGALPTPGYTLYDLRMEYGREAFFARINLNNVTNKQYFAPCRMLGDCFSGMPRTLMTEVGLRF